MIILHKEDGITKLIDGEVYYKFDYANFLYEELQKKDDEIDKYKNVIDKIKEKGVMYYDPEYSKIYGELCDMPGANNTRTPVIVIDEDILKLLEETNE